MIDRVHNTLTSETNNSTAGPNSSSPLSKSNLDSFHGALSDAVSSTLQKFGIHPNDVKISITRTSESSAARQPVGRDAIGLQSVSPDNQAPSQTPASPAAPDGGYDPFLQAAYSNPFASLSTSASSQPSSESRSAPANTHSSATSTTAANAQEAFDNAYWAEQPAAVQALRTMQDPDQRTALATQLASEGYSIDVPIMVWGWDPSIVTSMREADGYTWVPSALQQPVEDAPGLPAMGTIAAYNPNNPPPGSIAV
jgi:hypothetical protein